MSLPNPLIRIAQMIFRHGIQHSKHNRDLDRILAVVHSDNAIELLLKDRVKGFTGIEHKHIPDLLNDLRHDTIVKSLSGDIRLAHAIRNSAYHVGTSVDVYALNYVIDVATKLFTQYGLYPDGGEIPNSTSDAKNILIEALGKFTEAKLQLENKKLYTSVILLCSSALEKLLRERFEKEAFERFGDNWNERYPDYRSWNVLKLIKIMEEWRTFKDPILSLDLERLLNKRNVLVDTPPEINENEAREILQMALHFAFSPQPYFEMTKEMPTEEAIAQVLRDYDIPFETEVEFRLGKELFSSFDFVIPNSRKPIAIIEAKLAKIRSDYFKALLFDVELVKRRNTQIKFYLVYSRERLEEAQLAKMRELASEIADGFFEVSEITIMLEKIEKDLRKTK